MTVRAYTGLELAARYRRYPCRIERHTLRRMRVMNWIMLAAFVFSIVVQLNDPDPLLWVAVYGLAAIACAAELRGHAGWRFPCLVGAVALVWAVTITPRVFGEVPFLDMFGEFEMRNESIEESREMYGLLIIAGWMAILVARALRAGGGDAADPSAGT